MCSKRIWNGEEGQKREEKGKEDGDERISHKTEF